MGTINGVRVIDYYKESNLPYIREDIYTSYKPYPVQSSTARLFIGYRITYNERYNSISTYSVFMDYTSHQVAISITGGGGSYLNASVSLHGAANSSCLSSTSTYSTQYG